MAGLSGFGIATGSAGTVFAERMAMMRGAPGAGGPQASTIASIMSSIISGGAAAIHADPTATANQAASTMASGVAGAVTGALGGSAAPLVAALTGTGGLASALSSLATATSAMSGVTAPGEGAYGLSDVLAHASALTQFFGTASAPSSVSLSTVLAPLQSSPALASMTAQLSSLSASVIARTTTVAAAVSTVNGMTSQLNALAPASYAAISTLQTAAPAMQNALNAATAVGAFDPNLKQAAQAATQGNAAMAPLASAIAAIFTPTADEQGHMASFPDASAGSSGAVGGMTSGG